MYLAPVRLSDKEASGNYIRERSSGDVGSVAIASNNIHFKTHRTSLAKKPPRAS